jgi:serine/threonine protein phosphatase PrpC
LKYSVKSQPKQGEEVNGDGYLIIEGENYSVFCVIDGLGHGVKAHEVTELTRNYIEENISLDIEGLVRGCHGRLQRSRGVVLGLVLINWIEKRFSYIGVGNIEIRVISQNHVQPISYPGILGYNMEIVKRFDYSLETGMVFVLYTDGITSKIESEVFQEDKNPEEQAQYIIQNYSRSHDDATILIGVIE